MGSTGHEGNLIMFRFICLDFGQNNCDLCNTNSFDIFDNTKICPSQLIDWSYMDFSRTVQVTTTIHSIKEVIKKWHGGKIAHVTVCMDSFSERNELRDERCTLRDIGIRGSACQDKAPKVILMYDFKPDGSEKSDPILMY